MLVMEHGDSLWLAPLVTNNWLKAGMKIAVKNAPTRFGNEYEIASSADKGFIDAVIDPPIAAGARDAGDPPARSERSKDDPCDRER